MAETKYVNHGFRGSTRIIFHMNAFTLLNDRGFFYQHTDRDEIERRLQSQKVIFYLGIDPTADSLHVGHLLPLMAACWLYEMGHQPLILIGGGTAMIGDPSGKTEMRQMLTKEEIDKNATALLTQVTKLFDMTSGVTKPLNLPLPASPGNQKHTCKPIYRNNDEWLRELKYLEFLREFGRHFSINRMLSMDSVKLRLEDGLSFLEFNYMLLQAYDFYILSRDYDCVLQIGGQDQWGNIVAGVELIRKLTSKPGFGVTLPLLTDKLGRKFGKTVSGAVWLDENKTSAHDFYQFWRNVEDSEVGKLLALFTFLPQDEVIRLGALPDPQINRAKEILAYEVTALIHGHDCAARVFSAMTAMFGVADPEQLIETSSKIRSLTAVGQAAELPTTAFPATRLMGGMWIVSLLVELGLEKSNGAARRLIEGGGAYVNDEKVIDVNRQINRGDFKQGELIIRAGKKNLRRVVIDGD